MADNWNEYETAGKTLTRNHAKQKGKFDQREFIARREELDATSKLKKSQSKQAAVNDFVVDPEMVVKVGHTALLRAIEDIQKGANKLGSTPIQIVMSKAAVEKFLRALHIQHSDNMLDTLDAHMDGSSDLQSSYSKVSDMADKVQEALLQAGKGEHKFNEIVKKELVPELVSLLKQHMDHKQKVLHQLFVTVAGKTPESQANFLAMAMPEMSSQFMVEYCVKSARLATDFDEDSIRHFCESIRMMAGDFYESEVQGTLAKYIGNDLWKAMAKLGL